MNRTLLVLAALCGACATSPTTSLDVTPPANLTLPTVTYRVDCHPHLPTTACAFYGIAGTEGVSAKNVLSMTMTGPYLGTDMTFSFEAVWSFPGGSASPLSQKFRWLHKAGAMVMQSPKGPITAGAPVFADFTITRIP